MFKSTKWGAASLGVSDGEVMAGAGFGNKGAQVSAAASSASGVAEGVNKLAEQIGAQITALPGMTIGTWDGKARVALTNTTKPLHSKNFSSSVLKDFGENGEQAGMEYAVKYAFTHAVVDWISGASKNIIARAGDDIDKAMEKVLRIEDVPKRLAAFLDPVGYALDQFNKDWQKTVDALLEGGASAEEMADAQKLYRLELEKTQAEAQDASRTLKDFLGSIAYGSPSPYSLRDQEAMAKAALDPFLAKIEKGEYIDQSKFTDAASRWLEIERQLEGSNAKYFGSVDMLQAATNKAISQIDNAKPVRVETDPFLKATAGSTQASAELLDQLSRQTETTNQLLAQLLSAGGAGSFIGDDARYYDTTGTQ